MNFEQARLNLVEQQIRPALVIGQELRELLLAVRREDFVPAAWRRLAFADTGIPLGHGAAMLPPKLEAQALHALGIGKHERVLEIGTGSGYMAALLAVHAASVVSVEIVPELAEFARANLARAGIENVSVEVGNGAGGWPAAAPYDAIMVSGSLPALPAGLLAQLKAGGRLFAVVGRAPSMTACLVTRIADDGFSSRRLFETTVPPLTQLPADGRFDF